MLENNENEFNLVLYEKKSEEEQKKYLEDLIEGMNRQKLQNVIFDNLINPCESCQKYVSEKLEINNKYYCINCQNNENLKKKNVEEEIISEIEENEKTILFLEKSDILEELRNVNTTYQKEGKLDKKQKKEIKRENKVFEKYFEKQPPWIEKDFSFSWKKFEELVYDSNHPNFEKNLDLFQNVFKNLEIIKIVEIEFEKKFEIDLEIIRSASFTFFKKGNIIYFFGVIKDEKDFEKFNLKKNNNEKGFFEDLRILKRNENIMSRKEKEFRNSKKILANEPYICILKKLSYQEYFFINFLIEFEKKTTTFSRYLEISKSKGQNIIKKIREKHEKEMEKKIDVEKLKNTTNFLNFTDLLRKYQKLFNQYDKVERDINIFQELNSSFYEKPKIESGYIKEKEKPSEVIDSDCAVCFSSEVSYYNNVIYCHTCKQGAHLKCIEEKEPPAGNYYCIKCLDKGTKLESMFCLFCGNNKNFLTEIKVSSNKKKSSFHLFCMFTCKKWLITNNGPNFNLVMKSDKNCQICDKKKGVVVECSKCKHHNFHYYCAYFKGFFFEIRNFEKVKFDEFLKNNHLYNVNVLCRECSTQKFSDNIKDVVYKNSYYRRISIEPFFYVEFPNFKDYLVKKKKLI